MQVCYTLFPTSKHTQGEAIVESLEQFAARCGKQYPLKEHQPLAIPELLPGHSRAKNVEPLSATAVMLDFDKPVMSLPQACKLLDQRGAAYVAYYTFSSSKDKPRYRIMLPLSGPIELDSRRTAHASSIVGSTSRRWSKSSKHEWLTPCLRNRGTRTERRRPSGTLEGVGRVLHTSPALIV